MAWFKVYDDFYDNDKMVAAGSIGRDLYWHGVAFCNRNLTDGLIPKGRALLLVDFTDAAVLVGNHGGVDGAECAPYAIKNLLAANLWHENGHACPDCVQPGPRHYIVHDYLKHQSSRADVEEKVEATRRRVAAHREKRKNPTAAGNAVGNAVTSALVTPDVTLNVTPDVTGCNTPTEHRTQNTEGGGTAGAARESENNPPPPCSRHKDNSNEPCHACKARRVWDERHAAAQAQDELEAKRRARERVEECHVCHGTNWIPNTEPAQKCGHPTSEREQHA